METEVGKTITLSEALDIFSDDLPEIRDLLIEGLTLDIEELKKPVPTGNTSEDWVRKIIYDLDFKELTDFRLRMIKRITSYLDAKKNPRVGRITDKDIMRAKEYPIADIYNGRTLRSGKCLKGCCPFHDESTPSFYIYMNENRYKCFGCDAHGDVIDFYMTMNNCTFIQAVKKLI